MTLHQMRAGQLIVSCLLGVMALIGDDDGACAGLHELNRGVVAAQADGDSTVLKESIQPWDMVE